MTGWKFQEFWSNSQNLRSFIPAKFNTFKSCKKTIQVSASCHYQNKKALSPFYHKKYFFRKGWQVCLKRSGFSISATIFNLNLKKYTRLKIWPLRGFGKILKHRKILPFWRNKPNRQHTCWTLLHFLMTA